MSLEPNAKKARIATDFVDKEIMDGVLSDGVDSISSFTDSAENEMEDISEMVAGVFSENPLSQLESTTKFRNFLCSNLTSNIDEMIKSGVLPRFVEFLKNEDSPELQLEVAYMMNDIAHEKPEVVIDHGAVPILVQLLSSPNEDVTKQSLWTLGLFAISSTENRDFAINCGALTKLCSKLNEDTTLLVIRSWCLLSICQSPTFDQMKEALPAVKRLLQSDKKEVLENACLTLWYMCYGSDERIKCVIEAGFVPRLVQLFQHIDANVVTPVRRIIDRILAADKQQIQLVIDGGALPILFDLLTKENKKITKENKKITKMEACSMLTNITLGTDDQIQSVIDANLIPILVNLAQNAEMDIKTKATWAISLAASSGSDDQVRYLVKENCIKPLCDLLVCEDPTSVFSCLIALEFILIVGEEEKENTGVNYYAQLIEDAVGLDKIQNLKSHYENPIKEKAMKIVQTFWFEEDQSQNPGSRYLVEQSCIKPLCDILVSEDLKAISLCLDGLDNILKVGEAEKKTRDYRQLISDAEGQQKIENLRSHDNKQIKEKAVKILETYWPVEEDEDEEATISEF